MMSTRAHIWISGRVQGVFFRATTRRKANKHGVTGWVKNLRDGRVEAIFEGPREEVEEMIAFCHEGPSAAVVENVDVNWENPTGEFNEFHIKY